MSANTLKFITTFLSVGKINKINPKRNPVNAIAKSTAAKIVSVAILLNFNVNNCLFVFDDTNVVYFYITKQNFNKF